MQAILRLGACQGDDRENHERHRAQHDQQEPREESLELLLIEAELEEATTAARVALLKRKLLQARTS